MNNKKNVTVTEEITKDDETLSIYRDEEGKTIWTHLRKSDGSYEETHYNNWDKIAWTTEMRANGSRFETCYGKGEKIRRTIETTPNGFFTIEKYDFDGNPIKDNHRNHDF